VAERGQAADPLADLKVQQANVEAQRTRVTAAELCGEFVTRG
jgi:hypothetical protein